jgi:phosphoglycolate phosphatase
MTHLIFDFDGTIHDTMRLYGPAFRKAYDYLVDKGLAETRDWQDDEISGWLGYSSKDMWNQFMPSLPDSKKAYCSRLIGAEMLEALKSGRGRLYDGAAAALTQLKEEGFNLLFLSNCKIAYMRESIRQFSLHSFFAAFYCTEQYFFAPKHEVFQQIKRQYEGEYVMIGDRETDIRTAKLNGLPSVGCSYGYGRKDELTEATIVAESPHDIVKAVRQLCSGC